MKRWILSALFVLGLAANVWAQNPAPQPVAIGAVSGSGKATDVRQQTFDIVWQTVKDKHFDPTLGGVLPHMHTTSQLLGTFGIDEGSWDREVELDWTGLQ